MFYYNWADMYDLLKVREKCHYKVTMAWHGNGKEDKTLEPPSQQTNIL